jgi:hypothetical protein
MRFTAADLARNGRDGGSSEPVVPAPSLADDHMTAPTYQGTNSFWP